MVSKATQKNYPLPMECAPQLNFGSLVGLLIATGVIFYLLNYVTDTETSFFKTFMWVVAGSILFIMFFVTACTLGY